MECPICLEEFCVLLSFNCKHKFCHDCCNKLQKVSILCPLCRQPSYFISNPSANDCMVAVNNCDNNIFKIIKPHTSLYSEIIQQLLLSYPFIPRNFTMKKLLYINKLTSFAGRHYTKEFEIAHDINDETIQFANLRNDISSLSMDKIFDSIHEQSINRLTKFKKDSFPIKYKGIHLTLSTLTTTEDIHMNAIQYVVHNLSIVDDKPLAELIKEFPIHCTLIAAASLKITHESPKDYTVLYSKISSSMTLYELCKMFNLSLVLLEREVDKLYECISYKAYITKSDLLKIFTNLKLSTKFDDIFDRLQIKYNLKYTNGTLYIN